MIISSIFWPEVYRILIIISIPFCYRWQTGARFIMAAPVALRDDFDAAALHTVAKALRKPDQLRRLMSLAEIYDGGPRRESAIRLAARA